MTEYQFKFSMDKLSDQWKNFYSRPRLNLLFEIVKESDNIRFDNFIEHCLIDCKAPPLGDQFREFRQNELRITNHLKPKVSSSCPRCDGNGLFTLNLKADQQPYAYVCDCPAGEGGNFSKLIPRYSQESNVLEMKGND